MKDIAVYLPLGFLGDPLAAAQCTNLQLLAQGGDTETECPAASRVGQVMLFTNEGVAAALSRNAVGRLFIILLPRVGYPARFGFKASNVVAPLYASVVHTPFGYAVRVAAPGVPRAIAFEGAMVTFFGDPRAVDGEPGAPGVLH